MWVDDACFKNVLDEMIEDDSITSYSKARDYYHVVFECETIDVSREINNSKSYIVENSKFLNHVFGKCYDEDGNILNKKALELLKKHFESDLMHYISSTLNDPRAKEHYSYTCDMIGMFHELL